MKKYTPVFGDQSLFDGAPEDVDMIGYSGGFYKNSKDGPMYCCGCTFTTDEYRNKGFIAMRRIIAEPKCWTIADQQAGRLPPAGSKYLAGTHNIELECLYNDSKGNAWGFDAQGEVYGFAINYCYPVETQAEKAQRLRDEWRIKALSSASILSGMQEYELKRLGGYIGDIYDALLSGELSMPVKGGE